VTASVTDKHAPRHRNVARARSLRHGNQRAAVDRHVRPPTSPTTRVAASPEKACPQRTASATTVGINWPGPSPSERDPRSGPSFALEKLDPCRVRLPTSGHEARPARVGATGALVSRGLLISSSRAGSTGCPRVLQMRKNGGTYLPPRNGPIDLEFEA
jgi:hypothetical protein